MEVDPTVTETNQADVTCPSCGAHLKYNPGTTALKCEFCNAEIDIEPSEEIIQEIDFEQFLSNNSEKIVQQQVTTVKCDGCGAHTTLDPNIMSDRCPFCGSILIARQPETESQISPGSILPFAIDSKKAYGEFSKWIKKLWFAPNDLKKFVVQTNTLNGIYVPYWTYDSNTQSTYIGQRGDNYTTTETYTTLVNGKPETRTRAVTRVRWTTVSGDFSKPFDDVLVLASKSLPRKYADKLTPWDTENLTSYNPMYLSGYRTETYQVDLKEGFDIAQRVMEDELRYETRQRIGGDHQRILTLKSTYNDITFKHILLPIWISAFQYKGKVYRFLINGRTGEVQGERPYSAWKIVFTVIMGLIAIGAVALAASSAQ